MNVTTNKVIGIFATNREVLLERLKALIGALEVGTAYRTSYLRVLLPCGSAKEYILAEDIPTKSIECRCGDLDYPHWFIRYAEEG